jgi:hypothetical protein
MSWARRYGAIAHRSDCPKASRSASFVRITRLFASVAVCTDRRQKMQGGVLSVGGFSGFTVATGFSVDGSVLELSVVTGTGERLVCGPDSSTETFRAFLGGYVLYRLHRRCIVRGGNEAHRVCMWAVWVNSASSHELVWHCGPFRHKSSNAVSGTAHCTRCYSTCTTSPPVILCPAPIRRARFFRRQRSTARLSGSTCLRLPTKRLRTMLQPSMAPLSCFHHFCTISSCNNTSPRRPGKPRQHRQRMKFRSQLSGGDSGP